MQIDNVYVGEIRLFSGNFAPDGWAFCDGRLLDISTYTPLFTIIGNRYGGNGITNFALPDLRGRVPVHFYNTGISEYSMNRPGQKGGNSKINLTVNQLPSHFHTAQVEGNVKMRMQGINVLASQPTPTNAYPAIVNKSGNPSNAFALPKDGPLVDMAESNAKIDPAMVNVTVDPIGTGEKVNIMPPYLTIGYIIAVDGIMPHVGNMQEEKLTGLTIVGFQTVPAFNPSVKEYIIDIPATQNNIKIIPTADTNNATIAINSIAIESGKTQTIGLPSGSGIYKTQIDVLSRDGVVVTYSLASYKGMPLLNALTVSGGIPTTKFISCLFEYMIYADTSSDSIILTPSANIPNAIITINNVIAGNNAPFSFSLQNDQETINILVTSADKKLMTKYVINVKKMPLLSDLSIDNGNLVPVFEPTVFRYFDDVSNLVDRVSLTPTAMDPDSKIVVSSNEGAKFISVASGEKALVDLVLGYNSLIVGLSSKNNANTSINSFYRINIQRNAAQLLLSKLVINKQGSQDPCLLSPGFEPWVLNYTLYFTEPCVVQVAVSTREYYNASITIQGVKVSDSGIGTVQLNTGENIITIKIATESISTEYKITAYVATNEAYLTNIKTSIGQLQPAFLPNVLNYKLRINYTLANNYFNLTPYSSSSDISIKVDGNSVPSGHSCKIDLPNPITNSKTIQIIAIMQKPLIPIFSFYSIEVENDTNPINPQILSRYAFYDENNIVRAFTKANVVPCQVYCIVQTSDTPMPTKTQVVNGLNGKGQTALFHANSPANSANVAMFTTNQLPQGEIYQVCLVAQDMYGRNSEVSSVWVSSDKEENEVAIYS
jgi:microcystin-dependent protein